MIRSFNIDVRVFIHVYVITPALSPVLAQAHDPPIQRRRLDLQVMSFMFMIRSFTVAMGFRGVFIHVMALRFTVNEWICL
ncbi:hypothetical protein KKD49_03630 [Myxococcota bacterium]|nr:hypothetical protein [Myxococcota bacterium]